jgi:hypothetical protein
LVESSVPPTSGGSRRFGETHDIAVQLGIQKAGAKYRYILAAFARRRQMQTGGDDHGAEGFISSSTLPRRPVLTVAAMGLTLVAVLAINLGGANE